MFWHVAIFDAFICARIRDLDLCEKKKLVASQCSLLYILFTFISHNLSTLFVPLSQRQQQQKQISLPEHELKSKGKLRKLLYDSFPVASGGRRIVWCLQINFFGPMVLNG